MRQNPPGEYKKSGPPAPRERGEVIRPLWPEEDIAAMYAGRGYDDVPPRRAVRHKPVKLWDSA